MLALNSQEILQATLQAAVCITRCELLEPALIETRIARTADAQSWAYREAGVLARAKSKPRTP